MERNTTDDASRASPPTTLWSLRPAGEHAGLRRAAQAAGMRLRALPLQRLVMRDAGPRLAAALAASVRIYTSPAAVRFAARVADLRQPGIDIAVGAGSASALQRAGVREVRLPERMDSEGVLMLAELQALAGVAVGLVGAPGGRGLLPEALARRGAELRRADVYARLALHGGARRIADFARDERGVLLASSAEALQVLSDRLAGLSPEALRALHRHRCVASSARLAERLRASGFLDVVQAAGPTPGALVEAACTARRYND